jgi:hypothetical protein
MRTTKSISFDIEDLAEWERLRQMKLKSWNSDIHEVCRQAVKLEIARAKASKEYKYKVSKKEGKEEES